MSQHVFKQKLMEPKLVVMIVISLNIFARLLISVHVNVKNDEMGQFGAAVSAMDVSAMKCETCFLWNVTKVQNFALPS